VNVLTPTPVTRRRTAPSFSLAAFMPRAETPGGPVRLPRSVWIAGGLMGLTIVALATALAVKSGDPVVATATPAQPVATLAQPGQGAATQAPNPQAGTTTTSQAATTPPGANGAGPAANAGTAPAAQQVAAAPPVCASCGVVESYNAVQVQGKTNGVGAVAGGVGGAVIGSKVAGRGNHTLGGIVGAIGGGLLGNAVEKHARVYTMYDVHVRMDDGSLRTVRQSAAPAVGAHVTVNGNTLHAAPAGQAS